MTTKQQAKAEEEAKLEARIEELRKQYEKEEKELIARIEEQRKQYEKKEEESWENAEKIFLDAYNESHIEEAELWAEADPYLCSDGSDINSLEGESVEDWKYKIKEFLEEAIKEQIKRS